MYLYYRLKEKAKSTPDRVFLVYEERNYTFRQLETGSGRQKSSFQRKSNQIVVSNRTVNQNQLVKHRLLIRCTGTLAFEEKRKANG